jgi:hypothetical protein
LVGITANAFYVDPIRSNNAITLALGYDAANKEIVTSTGVGGGIGTNFVWMYYGSNISIPNGTTQLTWTNTITNSTVGAGSDLSTWTSPANLLIKVTVMVRVNPTDRFTLFAAAVGNSDPNLSLLNMVQGGPIGTVTPALNQSICGQLVCRVNQNAGFSFKTNNLAAAAVLLSGSVVIESFGTF